MLDIASEMLDRLRNTFEPAKMVLRGGPPRLTDEQKKSIEENCPVIPIDLKLAGDTLTVVLKWMREEPIDVPGVMVVLNGVDLTDEEVTRSNMEIITIKHPSLANFKTAGIAKIKLSYVSNVLTFDVFGVI